MKEKHGCVCKICTRNERLNKIFKRLSNSDVEFLSDIVETSDTNDLDIQWIKNGFDYHFYRKSDLRGIVSEKRLNDITKKNRTGVVNNEP